MTNSFDLVADPTRRRILEALNREECSVGALVERSEVSQPAVSRQLRVLREAGLVSARKDAQRRIYRLHPEKLKELDEWLQPFRKAWEGRLDRMEDVLASMED
ncbi:MAG: winged helix-turn-helix transcriptional regulator [Gemmatimonadetes bacterium]|nr:metalloregulator ArsR/SmtB family transcription factor [Gemmatimonadota bacterium]NNF11765.1 winged helix-turn-helix transcriptional regulator [Gemmatimonadota bacterium]